MSGATYEVPRRIRVDRMIPAELAIRNAMHEVEKMVADPRLTEALTLLSRAQDLVADVYDGAAAPPKPQPPVPVPTPHRIVEVNIAEDDANPVWRTAVIIMVWPTEFPDHPTCRAGVNVQVLLDGHNDENTLLNARARNYVNGVLPIQDREDVARVCARGLLHLTSVPHVGAPRDVGASWHVRGPRWRWPQREGA